MPPPFHKLTLAEFADLLGRFPFRRQINAVHMHHTWRPRHADYRGAATIEGMWRHHTKVNGWSDIAQHITIAPDGSIWTGRGWNEPPASAGGHNGNRAAGPFMFEIIGDFDTHRDPFGSPQRDVVLEVIARVQTRFNLPLKSLRFHNQMSSKSCPGSSVNYQATLDAVAELRERLQRGAERERVAGASPFPESARAQRAETEAVLELLAGEAARTSDPPEAEPQEDGFSQSLTATPTAGAQGESAEPAGGWGAQERPGGRDDGRRQTGRRRALCVGINTYPTAPLYGCVADAETWAAELSQLDFQVEQLHDEQATRRAILDGLAGLVAGSAPGDILVFQYAGHGTTVPDLGGDEVSGNNREDEAICPYDFATGAFVIDDDVAEIFRGLPDGVNLTCFFDCCHSGTISRFAIGASRANETRGETGSRPRFIRPTAELVEAHLRFRRERGRSRAALGRGPDSMKEVIFSACLDSEVAWETNGHGDFTTKATPMLRTLAGAATNEDFAGGVTAAFGTFPRQHPELDCSQEARARTFLQPLAYAHAGQPEPEELRAKTAHGGGAPNGGAAVDLDYVANVLRTFVSLIELRK